MALDKTGTITSGEPKVTDLLPDEGGDGRSAAAVRQVRWSKRVSIRWHGQFWSMAKERGMQTAVI